MWLKICDSHLTCKVGNKCLNVREPVELVESKIRWSPPYLCCLASRQSLWKKAQVEKKPALRVIFWKICDLWNCAFINLTRDLVSIAWKRSQVFLKNTLFRAYFRKTVFCEILSFTTFHSFLLQPFFLSLQPFHSFIHLKNDEQLYSI